MRRLLRQLLLVLTTALAGFAVPSSAEVRCADVLRLDDFQELQNSRGGYRNAFFRQPSHAEARRFSTQTGGDRSLRIEVERHEEGFCGAWVHLFDMRKRQPRSIDASPWKWLSFRVRGEKGGEEFDVCVADERWSNKEDAVTIGPVTDWLPQGVTRDWQTVVLPLSALRRLDLTNLASVSVSLVQPGRHTIQVDDLCLKSHADADVPAWTPEVSVAPRSALPRAMWVWSTADLIANPAERDRLFTACKEHDAELLWIQLPYSLDSAGGMVRCRIERPELLRGFLRQAHAAGIEVHAMDGCPEFSVRHRHSTPLAVIDAVVEFNQVSRPQECFDGVHFDNEPYLLLGWSNRRQRESILHDLITLNVECQQRCRQAGLQFGVDLPFWWSSLDDETGESVGVVTFQSERKSAAFHCIDRLDNVGIMNYRDRADGADGMLAHGLPLLRYAERIDNAAVFMGIETFRYEPQPVWFVVGLPHTAFRAALDDRGRDYYDISRDTGLRLFRMLDGDHVHVGVEFPADPTRQRLAREVAVRLARRFGHLSDGEQDAKRLEQANESVERSQEWVDFSTKPVVDRELGVTFPGFVATRLMAPKVTFADNPTGEIDKETSFAEETFGRFRSYRGFAIHSWESFRGKFQETGGR